MSDLLKQYRDQIDAIDEQMLKLVNQRAQLAREIGNVKNGGPIYRPEREAQVLRRLTEHNEGPLSGDAVTAIFRAVMSNCRALEKELSVAFLGPLGTFSEEAANKQFGGLSAPVQCSSIDEVFRMVESGQVDYGVVPVENSTEGAVGRTLDLLMATKLNICGEIALPIHHNLLSKSDSVDQIKTVYAHSQSLAQCHQWLNAHLPNADRQPVVSNAEAANIAKNNTNGSVAAIASTRAAELFSLNNLASNIEDDPKNTTRFLILATHDVAPSGKDKTSLVVATKNVPGAILELLKPLADEQVSLTKLESRPSKIGLWEYVFFVDIEGHHQDAAVSKALKELEARSSLLKVLGSYPVAII
ncbi:prephenate dehydratase [Methyloradius palustris]|uniref:Bifunctional chorismate mutase/prephenate dehydratase n=1 Tax=Methyloradius palustris TaxID=2778876 RepID=A0A8D5JQX0_9PROT|nr:prephenate dehydratase [Methyloradius palustris]BCM24896.1 chorismate mutase [Methyloradius palustris]